MDDALGHWFAGFVDGEGSFGMTKVSGSHNYTCRFALELRADDRPILEMLRSDLGIGTISQRPRRNANPQVVWVVNRKSDCVRLCEILDHYPLRSKKAGVYRLWREAVKEWQGIVAGQRADWTRISDLKTEIEATNKFQAVSKVA